MGSNPSSEVFRAGLHLFVLIGLLVGLFLGVGTAIVVTKGDWTFLAAVGGMAVVLFSLLLVLKLEVRQAEFQYRNLSGSRTVAFADVERAYFETLRADVAPQGVAVFWVQPRKGRRVKVNLRTFPIRAATTLFSALERHGVAIEVPDGWAAQRMARQIREEQERLKAVGPGSGGA